MKHNARQLDWLYIMGMEESVGIIDSRRQLVYIEFRSYLHVRNILLTDFVDIEKNDKF